MRAFYLEAPDGGSRFCLHHFAQGAAKRGQVVYLHAFAEEMNKARRMSALQARALARLGFEVLQIDLAGCGDSSGDFGDAGWQTWIADAVLACSWLHRQPEPAPLWIWGFRTGCLVAAEALQHIGVPADLLLVQPPASGKPLLQQFLRLKLAGEMLSGANRGLMSELRSTLARGEAVEIAGYSLRADLAQGLEASGLTPPPGVALGRRLVWLEVASQPGAEWTPVALQAQQRWREAGYEVQAELVFGPAFWQSTEIEEAPALLEATSRRLLAAAASAGAGTVGAQPAAA